MKFEEVVADLNKRGIFMLDLTQLENGTAWSVRLWSKSKQTTPSARGKTVEQAVKAALILLREQMTDKDWAEVLSHSQPRKRVRSK